MSASATEILTGVGGCGGVARPMDMVERSPGFAALSRLFSAGVRGRGMGYVGRKLIQVQQSSAQVLEARVRGQGAYSTRFRREGAVMHYGCSCPYFQERAEPCKHLYALALEQARSPLVREASTCRRYEPDFELLEEDEDDAFVVGFDDDDDSILADDDSPLVTASRLPRRHQDPRSAGGSWQELAWHARHAASRSPAREVELLYFLIPSLAPTGLQVVVAERKVGAEPEVFNPARRLDPQTLVHEVDRALYGLGLAGSVPSPYYLAPASLSVQVHPFNAPAFLARLAESGRCHVVPRERGTAWSFFASGQHSAPKTRERLGYDYRELLAWPRLTRAAGEPFRLAVSFADPRGARPKKRERALAVHGELLRGEERRGLEDVAYVHGDGLVLLGHELHALAGGDALWLTALAQHGPGHFRVSEGELPELLESLFGRHGVSALSLPPDYEKLPSVPPKLVVELDAPQGKRLQAKVTFDYGGRSVPAHLGSPLLLSKRQVRERDRKAERAGLEVLETCGFTGQLLHNAKRPELDRVAIDEKGLAAALHTLLDAGAVVRGEGRTYRASKGFQIEVESGIDWFEVKGEVRFDGAEVPFPALLAAIKQRRKTVLLGDGSVGVLPEAWMQRWGLVAELASERTERLRFSTRQIGLVQAFLSALPEDDAGARGLRALRRTLEGFHSVAPVRPARGFQGKLRPYQEQGLGFLTALGKLGFGACLADDMGLGKTIQVLGYLWNERGRGKARKPALVVVPRSLLSNWQDEAARFAPELVLRQHWGVERLRSKSAFRDVDIVLTTYGTLRLDIALLREVEFACVVLDEAQAIKNKHSATAKCAKLLRAERRIAMSGTPIENHLGELWSLFEFLNPGLLGELPGLGRALESPRPSEQLLGLVRTVVRPFVLRRTKSEVAKDLPERVEQTLYVELDADERRLYDELLKHYQASITKQVKAAGLDRATPHMLEALLRLRQAACHPGLIDEARRSEQSSKVECLLERLRALREEGHRALVFSQFTSLLAIVRARLEAEQIRFEYLDGKTRDRAGAVSRFQGDASIPVFLISLKAGGVGLNLTGADYVFILDPWWNPAAEAQAIDRTHRIGQTRNVIAYRLLSKHTVEERVAHLQDQKRRLVAGIMGDPETLSARLTRDDMQALLELTSADPRALAGS